VIEPGAVFELPPDLAEPPQRAYQENPPIRDSRWVLVVSSANDCADPECRNVLTLLLSSRVDLGGPFDVEVLPPNGGVIVPCIAQSDIVITVDKREMSGVHGARFRGTVLIDTLALIRAYLRKRLQLI
jgi:hypothetical protein